MQVSVESSAGLERRMRVQVPAEKIEKEVAARLVKVGHNTKVQGFRPGKVPAKEIRRRFGSQVRQEVLQDMLQSSYSEAVTEQKLRPAGGPTIEPESLEEGKDLAYVAVFEVYPEFEVKGFNKIKVETPEVAVGETDIDKMIDNLRKERGIWTVVERKAVNGDQVTLDFTGTLKGEPFEGGSATDFEIVVGDGSMLEDFDKNLKGVSAGEEKTFKLKFPKDYHAENLAGEKAEFAIKVSKVAEQALPAIDEEFVKSYGIESGVEADLRKDISANMQRELDAKIRAEIKRQVMEGLLEQNPIEIPDVLVQQESESMQKEAMSRMGIKDPAQAPAPENFRETAVKRVRLGLLLSGVIEEQKIELDRDRVTAKVDELVASYDNADEIRNIYLQNPQFLGQVENVVIEEQVVEWLQQQAKSGTKKMGFQELMNLQG